MHTNGTWQTAGALVILWLLLSAASYFLLVVPNGSRFDFYPRWVGARAALAGENPYSQPVTERIQYGMAGRLAEPGEDQQRFAYNALIVWLLLPFWLLPFPVAVSLWTGLQLLILLAAPVGVVLLLGWRIRPGPLLALLVFSVIGFRYPINAYLIGQFIPFLLGCLLLVWWGIREGRSVPVVLGLALLMVRPEVVLVPLLALLLLLWRRGERRVLLAWGALLALLSLLWLLTRLWFGPWELDFVAGLRAYQSYWPPQWPPGLFGAPAAAALVIALTLAWAGWLMRRILCTPALLERTGWVLAVAILTGLLLLPQTGNYTMILALLPAWLALWRFRGRYVHQGAVYAALLLPWFFHALGWPAVRWEHLFVPVTLAALLTLAWEDRQAADQGHPAAPAGAADP